MDLSDRLALSVADASQASGLSRSFLYEAMRPEAPVRLESIRVGGRRLILRTALERFLGAAGKPESA